jgi:excisionase family DNA binding protein
MNTIPNDLLTTAEATKLLGCSLPTLYRWIASGRLPSYHRAGSRRFISKADALALYKPMETTHKVSKTTHKKKPDDTVDQWARSILG